MRAKKIFAIIGIVLGVALAFAGAVIGIMALMGKFKTPDVFPDELLFTESEIVVVDEYDEDNQQKHNHTNDDGNPPLQAQQTTKGAG